MGIAQRGCYNTFCNNDSKPHPLSLFLLFSFPNNNTLIHASYYPLYPPPTHAPVDHKHLSSLAMKRRPDVLVLPSKVDPFYKVVEDNVVCINPGMMGKGTCAMVTVNPEDGAHSLVDRVEVTIVNTSTSS